MNRNTLILIASKQDNVYPRPYKIWTVNMLLNVQITPQMITLSYNIQHLVVIAAIATFQSRYVDNQHSK
jgi:hypothetical protein